MKIESCVCCLYFAFSCDMEERAAWIGFVNFLFSLFRFLLSQWYHPFLLEVRSLYNKYRHLPFSCYWDDLLLTMNTLLCYFCRHHLVCLNLDKHTISKLLVAIYASINGSLIESWAGTPFKFEWKNLSQTVFSDLG